MAKEKEPVVDPVVETGIEANTIEQAQASIMEQLASLRQELDECKTNEAKWKAEAEKWHADAESTRAVYVQTFGAIVNNKPVEAKKEEPKDEPIKLSDLLG